MTANNDKIQSLSTCESQSKLTRAIDSHNDATLRMKLAESLAAYLAATESEANEYDSIAARHLVADVAQSIQTLLEDAYKSLGRYDELQREGADTGAGCGPA